MAKAIKCDRCGEFADAVNTQVVELVYNPVLDGENIANDGSVDLCDPCWRDFEAWIELQPTGELHRGGESK